MLLIPHASQHHLLFAFPSVHLIKISHCNQIETIHLFFYFIFLIMRPADGSLYGFQHVTQLSADCVKFEPCHFATLSISDEPDQPLTEQHTHCADDFRPDTISVSRDTLIRDVITWGPTNGMCESGGFKPRGKVFPSDRNKVSHRLYPAEQKWVKSGSLLNSVQLKNPQLFYTTQSDATRCSGHCFQRNLSLTPLVFAGTRESKGRMVYLPDSLSELQICTAPYKISLPLFSFNPALTPPSFCFPFDRSVTNYHITTLPTPTS